MDVFVGMNDGTTGGAVAALISQSYKPGDKLATSGQEVPVEPKTDGPCLLGLSDCCRLRGKKRC